MGANDTLEQLEAARAEVVRLEAEVERWKTLHECDDQPTKYLGRKQPGAHPHHYGPDDVVVDGDWLQAFEHEHTFLQHEREQDGRQIAQLRDERDALEADVQVRDSIIAAMGETMMGLEAVIKDALAWMDAGAGRLGDHPLRRILAAAPSGVLAERDATKWDEVAEFVRTFHPGPLIQWASTWASRIERLNPYRTSEESEQ